jgi:hypothetical protein
VRYFCAVRTSEPEGWGGKLDLVLSRDRESYKVCRYTSDRPTTVDTDPNPLVDTSDPEAQYTANADHPRKYCMVEPPRVLPSGDRDPASCTSKAKVKVNLINQDFLVIDKAKSCPTEYRDDGTFSQGEFPLVVVNTRLHQTP